MFDRVTGNQRRLSVEDRSEGRFVRAIAAFASIELLNRIFRIAVIVILGRFLGADQIGQAALVLSIAEIIKAHMDVGVGQRIVAADDAQLEAVCNAGLRILVVWAVLLAGAQTCIAYVLWYGTANHLLFYLLAAVSAEYFFMAAGIVNCFRALRRGASTTVAGALGLQTCLSSGLTVALAVVAPGPAALVLPRLITAPVWTWLMWRCDFWVPRLSEGFAPLSYFATFGSSVLAIEVLRQLRQQADKIIVGATLGLEALGVYYFAFNAGLGITLAMTNGYVTVLFPRLCQLHDPAERRREVLSILGKATRFITPIILLQAVLAPFYVPILYGSKWVETANLVSILCLAALPVVVWSTVSQWLRANDTAPKELFAVVAITTSTLAGTALAAPFGLTVLAVTYVVALMSAVGLASFWFLRPSIPTHSVLVSQP